MNDWIDVEKELPPDNKMVCVLCLIPDPESYLHIKYVLWSFHGIFRRYLGWKVFFLEKNYPVIAWKELDMNFESELKENILNESDN